MDAYNRFLMRASGEPQHQAACPAESAVFAMLDVLKRHGKLESVLRNGETVNSEIVAEMVADAGRGLSRWR